MSKVSRSPLRSLLIASVALIAAAPVVAQSTENETITVNHSANTTTRSVGVSRAGLNLADGRDYARFQSRVVAAADKVCADEGLWNKFGGREYNQCRKSAIATAMNQAVASGAVGAN